MKLIVALCALALLSAAFAGGYATGSSEGWGKARLAPLYGGTLQELPFWACEELVEWRVAAWASHLHASERAVRMWQGKRAGCGQ